MADGLTVFWGASCVGKLVRNDDGVMLFGYDEVWLADDAAPAISVSLPKREGFFTRRETRPFFAGLLPEENQREAAARAAGVSATNDYALLDALGGDVAGALSLLPDGQEPPDQVTFEPRATSESDFARLLVELPRRPFLVGDNGIRMSLAGAQPKLPIVLLDGVPALPSPGQPTTHIVKPTIARFPGSVDNEAFAMRLAAAVGLDVAPVQPKHAKDIAYLLVERFDRARSDDVVVRIHQEDFCQALGFAPEHKYAAEKGPSFADCFQLVRNHGVQPAKDVLHLLDAAIFNATIGNADAHGKNFSLLYRNGGAQFAPLYDLMVTAHYPEVATRFAMPIGHANQIENLDFGAWARFSADMELGGAYVRRRVAELITVISASTGRVVDELGAEGCNHHLLASLAGLVESRAARLLEGLRPV